MNPKDSPRKEPSTKLHKSLTIVGIVMCVILVPILIVNCTLILKSFVNKETVPDFGGMMPLIVLTDSMYPDIQSGDIIICRTTEAEDVKEGDVISFFDPAGNGTTVVTHKVIERTEENGKITFRTQGINNNSPDRMSVPEENLVGAYTGIRIPGAGNVAIFMQTTPGFILCVFVPLILFVGYDMIQRRRYEKTKGEDMAELMAELEELRNMKQAAAGTQEPDRKEQDDEPKAE